MRNIFVFIVVVFLSNNCTTPVFMNRMVPPRLTLEKQPANIVFKNYFNYQNTYNIKEKHESAYKTGIEIFANTLVNFTPPDKPMAIFNYDSTINNQNMKIVQDTILLKRDITSSCKINNAEFLLSMDSLTYYFDNEVTREENDDGSVSKTKDFYLFSLYYLTLYDTLGNVLDRSYIEKSTYYTSRPTLGALITFKPNLAKATNKIQKLAKESGTRYMGMFYPSLEKDVLRKLYTGKALKETNSLIKSGNYDEAIMSLQELRHTLKPKQAEKAEHNLEVAIELKQNNIAIGL